MNRKDIIIISVIVNAGLLVILLISALTTKESYLVSSSAQVANTILESDTNGMVPKTESAAEVKLDDIAKKDEVLKVDGKESPLKLETAMKEEPIVHQLPATETVPLEQPKPEFTEVIVKKGDTIEKIAKTNHSTVSQIVKANDLSNTFLRVGQTLKIPKVNSANTLQDEKKADYYTVKVGDNPWTIAMKHHLKVDELLKLNKLNSKTAKKLRAGDKLRIR